MVLPMDREQVVRTARCTIDKFGVYRVQSQLAERLEGVADSEGEAWQMFFDLLDVHAPRLDDGGNSNAEASSKASSKTETSKSSNSASPKKKVTSAVAAKKK